MKGNIIINTPPQTTKWDKRLEQLTKENEELKNNIQEYKRKIDALRARNKVLESDGTAQRAKLNVIMEQSERDHEMITSLTAKVSHAQEIQNDMVQHKQNIINKMDQENKNLQLEIAKQSCKMDNLAALFEDQKREIEILRSRNKKQKQSINICNSEIIGSKNAGELEVERLRLLELTKLGNERLGAERMAHAETQTKLRSERQKTAKLEAKVARLQLDHKNDQLGTYSSRTKDSSNITEDKLQLAEETIKALETRLQIEKEEHKTDINEFSKILSNYGYVENTNWNCTS